MVRVGRGSAHYWWPWLVAGLILPLASALLRRWLGPVLAQGFSFFVLFLAAGLLVKWITADPEMRVWKLTLGSAAGALLSAVISAVFFPRAYGA